jgi:hypothetical protein
MKIKWRDLRIANLKSYREPDYKIVGPKERGGPAGVILKNGYIVAQWEIFIELI